MLLALFASRITFARQNSNNDYILVLHSINFSEVWTAGTNIAIQDAFSKDNIKVKGEELQIPALKDTTEANRLTGYLKEKYTMPPKVVVCIGDPAWIISRPLFDKEWKNVPALICYSQDLVPPDIEHLVDKNQLAIDKMVPTREIVKGYNVIRLQQPVYIKETINTIKKLQPDLTKIVFIGDERYISIRTREKVRETIDTEFPELQLDIISSPGLSTEKLLDTLSTYHNNAGILYYSWFASKSAKGDRYLTDNVQKIINNFSTPPVFILSDLNPESGEFAGGYYIAIKDFSKAVVSMIRSILDGKGIEIASLLTGGEPRTYLNYQHLFSHGINPSLYPLNAVYFQQPPSFIEKYKVHLISAFSIIVLLGIIIALRFRLYIQKLKQEDERREKEKAEEANRLKSAFLANMSHEIRTPLNAIVGFSNLIANAESQEESQEFYKIVETNNELLLQLVNDILDLSKIEAGQLEFNYSNINVSSIFVMLKQTFQNRTKEGVHIECVLPEKTCFIHSEKTRLTQVITNFLTNACKFTFEGTIRMGYEEIEGGLRFFVSDTGKGIAKENIPHVFERFAKFDNFIQGTGLGLSISQTIVKRLNGEIGVESEEGKGSTFWFTIPCEVYYEEIPVKAVTSESAQ